MSGRYKLKGPSERLKARIPSLAKAQREYLAKHGPWKAMADIMRGDRGAYVEAARKARRKNSGKRKVLAQSVSLKNFTGKVRLNPNKTVSVLGKGKRA